MKWSKEWSGFDKKEMNSFCHGLDVLGVQRRHETVGAVPLNERALVIRVRNIADLVKAEGGAAGELLAKAAPGMIEAKVYSEMATRMKKEFADQKVDAEINVVDAVSAPNQAATPPLRNTALFFGGAITTVGSYVLFRLVSGGFGK